MRMRMRPGRLFESLRESEIRATVEVGAKTVPLCSIHEYVLRHGVY
jgi:hypothetical protein